MKAITSTVLSITVLGFLLVGFVIAKCLMVIDESKQEAAANKAEI